MFSLNWGQLLESLILFFREEAIGIAISLAVIFFIANLFLRLADHFVHQDKLRHDIKKNTKYTATIILLFWLLILYNSHAQQGQNFHYFIIGVFLAGIAFTMRDVFSNVVGWMIIASHKGFKTGDRVHIGTVIGDVLDVGVLRTTIAEVSDWDTHGEQSTGRLVSLPNSVVLKESVINYNRSFSTMWNELSVVVTFESDWAKAEELIQSIADSDFEGKKDFFKNSTDNVKRELMLEYHFLTPKVYVKVIDVGVELTLRHLVEVRKRRAVADQIFREILNAFNKEKSVTFAYPTTRFYKAGE